MSKRRGRRSKKRIPVSLLVVLVIVVVIVVAVILFMRVRNAPTTDTVNLKRYYNLEAHTTMDEDGNATEYSAAADNQMAIVVDNTILEDRAVLENDETYLGYSFVRNNIDPRFYYDSVNDRIIVTNAMQTITAQAGSTEYSVDGETAGLEKPVSIIFGDELYLSEEFVDKFSSIRAASFENPSRIYIQAATGTIKKATVNKDTQIRIGAGNKSEVVTEIPKDTKVTVIDEVDGWTEVMDERGYPGYIDTRHLSNVHDEEVVSDYDEPEYSHILLTEPVNMLWHGVFYYGQDSEIFDIGDDIEGINVISPRWYSVELSDDFVEIFSNEEYMNYTHGKDWQVWAMITDDSVDADVDMTLLKNTDNRRVFINTIMEDVKKEGIDGLNVDFEKINSESGDDFIQFIRELSIECRKEGVVLSVDNYTPYAYNAAYHVDQQSQCCDYVTIMAYDHYVGTEEIGPNSSLDFLQEVMDVTLPQVDESRLVIALPFYSRFWVNRGGTDLQNEVHSMAEAKELLINYGIETTWNETTGLHSAQFDQDGSEVYAWVEDAESIKAKLEFLKQYNIAGVAWWNLGQQTNDVWEVISRYY